MNAYKSDPHEQEAAMGILNHELGRLSSQLEDIMRMAAAGNHSEIYTKAQRASLTLKRTHDQYYKKFQTWPLPFTEDHMKASWDQGVKHHIDHSLTFNAKAKEPDFGEWIKTVNP